MHLLKLWIVKQVFWERMHLLPYFISVFLNY